MDKKIEPGPSFISRLLLLNLPAYLLLAVEMLRRHGDLASMVALRLTAAQRILGGEFPYSGFFDWSQPIVFVLFLVPQCLSKVMALAGIASALEVVTKTILLVFVGLSILLTVRVFDEALKWMETQQTMAEAKELSKEVESVAIGYVLSIIAVSWLARFDFGELQHLLILCMAPWLALRFLSYKGVAIPKRIAIYTGALCGLGISLDLPFVLVPLGLELVCQTNIKAGKPANQVAWYGVLASLALAAALIILLPGDSSKAFWTWIMPLKVLNYQVVDETLFSVPSSPNRADVIYIMCICFVLAISYAYKTRWLLLAANVIVMGFAFYCFEKQGYTHDLLLVMFGSCATIGILFVLVACRHGPNCNHATLGRLIRCPKFAAPLLASLIFSGLCACHIELQFNTALMDRTDPFYMLMTKPGTVELPDIERAIVENSQVGAPVAVIADFPSAGHPLVENLHRTFQGYLLWGRPLRLWLWMRKKRKLDKRWDAFYLYITKQLRHAIRDKTPDLMLIESQQSWRYFSKVGLAETVEANYENKGNFEFSSTNHPPREFAGCNGTFTLYKRLPDIKK